MNPQTVSDLYPSRWLKADDLNGRTITLKITAVTLEPIRNPRTNKEEIKAIMDFGRTKRLILNKTQCLAMADIARSEVFADWPETAVTLRPARAHNNKPTIIIIPAPAPTPAPLKSEEEKEE